MLVVPALEKGKTLPASFIDWEYARIGRGVSYDFAMATAHYAAFVYETQASTESRKVSMCIQKFRYTLVSEYYVASRQEGSLWPLDLMNGDALLRRTPNSHFSLHYNRARNSDDTRYSKQEMEM